MSKQYFQIDNEEKRIVLGPAMIPDQRYSVRMLWVIRIMFSLVLKQSR